MMISTAARPCGLFIFIAMALVILWPVQAMAAPGGREKVPDAENSVQLQDLAVFAVKQYNSKQGLHLQYVRLVSAEQQVVSGMMYYLVIETASEGKSKYYEAQVWVQAWKKFKSLQSFKPVAKSGSGTNV
eukprot:c21450_g1_i1 orf=85-474(+)